MTNHRYRRRDALRTLTLCAIAVSAIVAVVALTLLAAPNGIG